VHGKGSTTKLFRVIIASRRWHTMTSIGDSPVEGDDLATPSAPQANSDGGAIPASFLQRTFMAFEFRNYRVFALSQLVSTSGTFLEGVALALLVLNLTGSGKDVGIVLGLQWVPTLLLGLLGGSIADRIDKRRTLLWTQSLSGVVALCLAVVVATGAVEIWMVYALAAAAGVVSAIEMPVRYSFPLELVSADMIPNVVPLTSVLVSVARVLGPTAAGVLVAVAGLNACFFVNAASFGVGLVGIALLRVSDLHKVTRPSAGKGGIREGLHYVRVHHQLLCVIVMMTIVGTLAWEFPVSLPLLAEFTFGGNASTLSAMLALVSAGGIAGGLFVAGHGQPSAMRLCGFAALLGILMFATAVAPNVESALTLMAPMGAAGVMMIATGNTLAQLAATPEMRGRIAALLGIALAGSTAIGAPIVGWAADEFGARYGVALGAVSAVVTAMVAFVFFAKTHTLGAAGPTTEVLTESPLRDR
jgi:MFS family permease